MEKEARDKFEEGNVVRPYNPTQSYLSNQRKLEQWAIVKMAERASNVAKDWTKGWERTRRRQGKRHLGET